MITLKCRHCSAVFQLSDKHKDRLKCFDCLKLGLYPVEESVKVEQPQETKLDQDDGKDRFGRRKVKVIIENKFHDDGTQCVEDKAFTEKVGFTVSPREERLSQLYKRTCSSCKKEFETRFEREYRCANCSRH